MTEDDKWQAVSHNNSTCDGRFYYAVKSTGVFCRPSCPSRIPNRAGVAYFDTAQQAQDAGYRPCKRCRPDLADHLPGRELAERMKAALEAGFADKAEALQSLRALGVSANRAIQLFKEQYGVTPGQYVDSLRAQYAAGVLAQGTPVLDVAQELGFGSLSAFYAFYAKHSGSTPGRAQRKSAPAQAEACMAYDTDIGPVTLYADGDAVTRLDFGPPPADTTLRRSAHTDEAARQLREYFAGQRTVFTVALRPEGTEFQRKVWAALLTIPYGQTRTYGQIAAHIGQPTASRAVGIANNRNPIAIFIPCHRVVGASGDLVGYAGGLDVKRRLLELEARATRQEIQGEFDL